MPVWAIILISIVVVLIIAVIACYNSLINLDERVNEAWSDITVQLKYRADLIPNIVEAVKGYAKHEKDTFMDVTKARTAVGNINSVKDAIEAEKEMQSVVSRIMAVAESYPELKANENFMDLQGKLQDCEDKLQAARRFYNAGAKDLNTKIKVFPTVIINKLILHFKKRDYFNVDSAEMSRIEKAPEVKF